MNGLACEKKREAMNEVERVVGGATKGGRVLLIIKTSSCEVG